MTNRRNDKDNALRRFVSWHARHAAGGANSALAGSWASSFCDILEIPVAGYYFLGDGKQTGPFGEVDVLRLIREGAISSNQLCRREDRADWQPIAAVLSMATKETSAPTILAPPLGAVLQSTPLFLYIPVARLILMSILSFGLYEPYWMYKNWRCVKERDNLPIRPFWRAVFGIFYCHSLLRRIRDDKDANSLQMPSFSPNVLATTWVVLTIISNVLSRAPGIAVSIVAAFIPTFLCLVPVQNYVNSVTERGIPGQLYHRWSWGHIVLLVTGLIIWALLLLG